jgi:hypothetical protein
MGATAGAFAAAATTPLDVIKTNMMCAAASRPTMASAARAVLRQGGPSHFFRCAPLHQAACHSRCPGLRISHSFICPMRATSSHGSLHYGSEA